MSEDRPTYLTLQQELNALDLRDSITNDPSASHWLKQAIAQLWERDVVDALNDLAALRKVLEAKHHANMITLKWMVTSDEGHDTDDGNGLRY